MKPLIALLTLLTLAGVGRAETATQLLIEPVEVVGTDAQTRTTIASMDAPQLRSHIYHARGEVGYEQVEGTAYLELISEFGSAEHRYFTRSLSPAGPTGVINGTSDWRPFELPFRAEPDQLPTRIELNVVLPGKGVVRVRNVALGTEAASSVSPWWSSRTSGFIGAAVGTSMGILGAMVGVFGARGKGRRLMPVGFAIGMLVGLACLIVGAVAAIGRQPYAVWYPLLLTGFLLCTIIPVIALTIRKARTQQELNRMRAADVG
jgi:hypothetical protein